MHQSNDWFHIIFPHNSIAQRIANVISSKTKFEKMVTQIFKNHVVLKMVFFRFEDLSMKTAIYENENKNSSRWITTSHLNCDLIFQQFRRR